MNFTNTNKTFVIAEIGANHNGDMDLARKMIDEAKSLGCDAVKFQSWDTSLFSKQVYEKNFFLGDDYRKRDDFTLKEIVDKFAVSHDQLQNLKSYCDEIGIIYSTTPFSVQQLNELMELDPAFIKIASMDLNNERLLKASGETQKPVIFSTGFGTLAEIDQAVRWIEATGNSNLTILHCVSLYPPQDNEVNLNNMDLLRDAFGYPVGFSDHSLGAEIALASIAKGATVLEKHFTLDKTMFGWDHHMSADPQEMKTIMDGRDRICAALGSRRIQPSTRELERRDEYRRSIVSVRTIPKGTVIRDEDLDYRRPGTGLAPSQSHLIIGCISAHDIPEDTLISVSDIEKN